MKLALSIGSAVVIVLAAMHGLAPAADISSPDFAAQDLFEFAKVRTIELSFAADQFKAMTPRYGGRGQGFLLGPEGGHNGFLAASGLTFDWAHADLTIDGKA